MPPKNKSNEIRITRLYDAPVKAVWDAWTDPKQVAQWWGPRGFTLTTHSKDLRPGGSWSYTMHGPDGVDYKNKTQYFEVEEYSRLVYDHGGNDDRPPLFRVTVQFTETGGKTKMEMSMSFSTPEVAEDSRKFIKKAGGEGTWDRLAEYLAKQSTGKERFVINRTFDAPIETMYRMWTDPELLAQWVSPTGFNLRFLKADIKPGGSTFSVMMNDGGMRMHAKAIYLEMSKPHRIVYTQQFSDENEKTSRHPMAPTLPETILTTVVLAEEGPASTRITLTWEPYGSVTREELETFNQAKSGMAQGWTGSFDKLEAQLATVSG